MRRNTLFALALLLLATTAFAETTTVRKGFDVPDGGTLRLEAGVGDITVIAGGTGVAVEIVQKTRGRDGERQKREHEITFAQEGNDVVIKGKRDRDNFRWFDWWGDDYRVEWNIRVPSRYNVELRTSGGSIELANLGGSVDARTSGGSIEVGKLTGPATLRTSGGSIRIDGSTQRVDARTSGGSIRIGETTGPVEARTSGGSITIEGTGGDVVARTSGGGIKITGAMGSIDAATSGGSITAELLRQPTGDSKLSTSGGGVTVAIAEGLNFDLDARASGGGVSSDVPVTILGRQDDDTLSGTIGRGGPRLVLRTSGGGVRVKKHM